MMKFLIAELNDGDVVAIFVLNKKKKIKLAYVNPRYYNIDLNIKVEMFGHENKERCKKAIKEVIKKCGLEKTDLSSVRTMGLDKFI